MRSIAFLLISFLLATGSALAVPETVSVRVTDVTTTSFALVWLTDVAADPAVQVFRDAAGANPITETLAIVAMPDTSSPVVAAARQKGIMKVRVSGLDAATSYYVRTVTADPANPASVGYSSLQEVTTATAILPYRQAEDGNLSPLANDLLAFRVYIRPADPADFPGLGDLLLLEADGGQYPLSTFAGEGIVAPEGILDLNNLFGVEGESLDLLGGEKATLRIYRGNTLSTLLHYRRFPVDDGQTTVTAPVQGFFADINLDGKVDGEDFELFKTQYRLGADDPAFNPDSNFFPVETGKTVAGDKVDVQDFARFAPEYGRTNVP